MTRTVLGALVTLALAACTPPLEDGLFQDIPVAEASEVAVGVGEPVEITLTSGLIVAEKYYQEEFASSDLRLGACLTYGSDRTVRGGLCNNDDKPLPDPLEMVSGTTYVKDFGNLVVKRGEHLEIQHTFAFTSSRPGEVVITPAYQVDVEGYEDLSFEAGTAARVTFE